MKSYSLASSNESSNWLDDTMSPPAANSESTPPAQKPSDHGYEVENMEAIRHDFLLRPKVIHRATIDWKQTRLLQYEGLHAVILDNALTAYECEMLIKQAETTTGGVWEQAMVNVGGGRQQFVPDTRDCGRIIWDDRDMVARIWDRVKDYVPEIHTLVGVPRVTGKGPAKRKEIWKMSRCNERMRFLKYGEGQYFKRKPSLLHINSFCFLLVLTRSSSHGRLLRDPGRNRALILYATPLPQRRSTRRRNLFPLLGHGAPT